MDWVLNFDDEVVCLDPESNTIFNYNDDVDLKRRAKIVNKNSIPELSNSIEKQDKKKSPTKFEETPRKTLTAIRKSIQDDLLKASLTESEDEESMPPNDREKHKFLQLFKKIANEGNENDTDDVATREARTIAMMRYCGFIKTDDSLRPGDFDIDKIPKYKGLDYMHRGKHGDIPLFLNPDFFQPRPSPTEIEKETKDEPLNWQEYEAKNGTLNVGKLKEKLEDSLPLWKRIARLNGMPDPEKPNDPKPIRSQPIFSTKLLNEIMNANEAKTPWSELKKQPSQAFRMALASLDSSPPPKHKSKENSNSVGNEFKSKPNSDDNT